MQRKTSHISAFITLVIRECKRMVSRPLYFFGMIFVPLFCFLFFPSLMKQGLPKNIPIGLVDEDNSSLSRRIGRNLDAMELTQIVHQYESVSKAREAIQKNEIYGFMYLPVNLSKDVKAQRQPKISFYTNNAYIVPGSLLFKDMKRMSELTAAAVNRELMYARGASENKVLATLQPIVIESYALGNPWLNYSIYLTNILLPGLLGLMIFMMTVYAIGVEIKDNTAREWLSIGNHSVTLALTGKLFPHTIVFFLMGAIYNIYLYGILNYPINSGIFPMLLATFFFILASQAFGIFMITVMPSLRMGLSFASLWGMISFSISGFSFPAIAMYAPLQAVGYLFPLRHYYLIYVSQALNGYPLIYAWKYYIFLLLFILFPFLTQGRLKKALIYFKYIP
ncbi:ABC-2 type transport system permease protein [Balneicella halophila]|uniref:ABC-2 type transport system permease protein n=1 Tax=Balneicella halophila TaxID=1537566 RepID=A0A7L4UQD3_BALHA|nr:ABC transporter permease [Balneicella halophila]PVX51953.1 ABC-2 type transport system permease protein [Balneicella halophila]